VLAIEDALGALTLFEALRPDEVARVTARFQVAPLAPGETMNLESVGSGPPAPRMAVLVAGSADLAVELPGAGTLAARLEAGDRVGEMALLTGRAGAARLTAREPCVVAVLDRTGLDSLLAEFPAIALPLVAELARELSRADEIARELEELHAEGLPAAELADALENRRRALQRRGARVMRSTPRAMFRRTVVRRGAEPSFWMLTGFLVSLLLARLVVASILHFGLEHRLFALVPGHDPNPMHVHHFNYGLVLIGVSGIAALFPVGRRALRPLAFLFGVGCGLVFDEFALFWNLDPEYAQRLSLVAAALMAALLVQVVYFGRFWRALLRRAWLAARGSR
jgi:CRP-like cAMP-binding protein